jgi:hypothetical protein
MKKSKPKYLQEKNPGRVQETLNNQESPTKEKKLLATVRY